MENTEKVAIIDQQLNSSHDIQANSSFLDFLYSMFKT